jgi:hypothetical protein
MRFCKASLFCALFVAVCLPAVAQTTAGVRLDIPFNFVASGKTMPAGHYTVAPVFDTNRTLWRIDNGHDTVLSFTNWIQSPQHSHRPSLVFRQSGGNYSLVQFWTAEHFGQDLVNPKTKQMVVAEGSKYLEIAAE